MSQRGSVSILVCAAAFLLAIGTLAVADAGAMLVARARAQAAADAAALAAVAQQAPILGQGSDPYGAARSESERNGATLVSCSCRVGEPAATVVVEVAPRVAVLRSWTGRRVRARATAEIDPALFTYRSDP